MIDDEPADPSVSRACSCSRSRSPSRRVRATRRVRRHPSRRRRRPPPRASATPTKTPTPAPRPRPTRTPRPSRPPATLPPAADHGRPGRRSRRHGGDRQGDRRAPDAAGVPVRGVRHRPERLNLDNANYSTPAPGAGSRTRRRPMSKVTSGPGWSNPASTPPWATPSTTSSSAVRVDGPLRAARGTHGRHGRDDGVLPGLWLPEGVAERTICRSPRASSASGLSGATESPRSTTG